MSPDHQGRSSQPLRTNGPGLRRTHAGTAPAVHLDPGVGLGGGQLRRIDPGLAHHARLTMLALSSPTATSSRRASTRSLNAMSHPWSAVEESAN